MKEILRWIHAENERLGIDPLRMTLFPIMSIVGVLTGVEETSYWAASLIPGPM